MAKRTRDQLKVKIDSIIKTNGNREITPPKHNSIETDVIDSYVNSTDGGFVVDAAVGYSSNLMMVDDRQFASVKFVNDSLTGGTVTSVGIIGADFDISNSPITSAGNISISIKNNAVTFAKFQKISTNKLLGRSTAGSGNVEEITLGTGLTLISGTLNAGSVVDSGSSTDNAIARYDGVTGKVIQNSTVIIEDDGTVKMTDTTLKAVLNVPSSGIIAFGADFTYCYVPVNIGRPGKSSANEAGDSITVQTGIGKGSGAESMFIVSTPTIMSSGSTDQTTAVRMRVGSWVNNTNSGFCALYLGNGAATGINYALLYSSSSLVVGHTSQIQFLAGGTGLPAFIVTGSAVTFGGRAAGFIPAIFKAHASQSADLTQWQNSASVVLAKVDATGNATFPSLTVIQPTIGTNTISYSTTNTTSSVRVIQNRITTTDSTVTTLQSIAIPTGQMVICDVDVSAIRTGGSSGSSGDMAGSKGWFIVKNVGGTVTIQDSSIIPILGDQPWPITFEVSGTNVLIRVQGTSNNNVTWNLLKCEIKTGGV